MEETMSKLMVAIAAATFCAAVMVSLRADAMTGGALAPMRAAMDAANPVEKVACGWYPSGYPQSWAVYTRGWGCRYVYSPYYYDPYFYRPYYRVYDPLWYRSRPRLWYSWY
jgi:hypothetical protein